MNEQKKKNFIETINEVIGVDITTFDENTAINTISEWDSFNNLMLIAKFQEDFKIEFNSVDVENTRTIGELFNLLDSKCKD